MQIKAHKSSFYKSNLSLEMEEHLSRMLPYNFEDLNCGFKYLGYMLKRTAMVLVIGTGF